MGEIRTCQGGGSLLPDTIRLAVKRRIWINRHAFGLQSGCMSVNIEFSFEVFINWNETGEWMVDGVWQKYS